MTLPQPFPPNWEHSVTVTLTLERKLDFRAAGPLAQALRDATGQAVALDAGQTVQIGAQSLQVILAAAKSAIRNGQNLTLLNVAGPLAGQMALMGFRVADVEAGGDAVARAWG